MAPYRNVYFEFGGQNHKVSMFAGSEILYHLAQDVEKICSVSGKLAISSDQSVLKL